MGPHATLAARLAVTMAWGGRGEGVWRACLEAVCRLLSAHTGRRKPALAGGAGPVLSCAGAGPRRRQSLGQGPAPSRRGPNWPLFHGGRHQLVSARQVTRGQACRASKPRPHGLRQAGQQAKNSGKTHERRRCRRTAGAPPRPQLMKPLLRAYGGAKHASGWGAELGMGRAPGAVPRHAI